jgi:chromosome partitioning protein
VRVGVMQGDLRDFDLASILQVVGLGRQYTGVELQLEGGKRGAVFVKSGKVVDVQADDLSGADALASLFNMPRGAFFVFRSETPANLPEPLGSLNQLVLEAKAKSIPPERESLRTAKPASSISAEVPISVTRSSRLPDATSTPEPKASGSAPHSSAVVAVASPKGGCGKSTIALNLALSLARRGNSVVLLDGDINGDILSALNARDKAKSGVLDVMSKNLPLNEALLETALPQLKIAPAVSNDLPELDVLEGDHSAAWRRLLQEAAQLAEVVIVDTPAGMFGPTRQILAACTHVLGVLQAEAVAERSFERFAQGLKRVGGSPPQVLGVVMNMLQTRHPASVSVLQKACVGETGHWLFETMIPRHPAFLNAAQDGLPLRPVDDDAPAAVAFLFDNLASEVAERLPLAVAERKRRALLL